MPTTRRFAGSAMPDFLYWPASGSVFNRLTEEKETDGDETVFDERYVWDGSNLLEVLDGSNNVTERYLNGPAVDQVLATEMVGGDNPGVNWLLQDAQQSVRTSCAQRRATRAWSVRRPLTT